MMSFFPDPPKWWEVYTSSVEQTIFIALARNSKGLTWRSLGALAKETNLSEKLIESILVKYMNRKPPLILQNKSGLYGYWESNPDALQDAYKSLTEVDKSIRKEQKAKLEENDVPTTSSP